MCPPSHDNPLAPLTVPITLLLGFLLTPPIQAAPKEAPQEAPQKTSQGTPLDIQEQLKRLEQRDNLQINALNILLKRLENIEDKLDKKEKTVPIQPTKASYKPLPPTTVKPEQPLAPVDHSLPEASLFARDLTLEIGTSYSHFDRAQFVLNGFLALDAIFLGNLSIDNVESDVLTTDFTLRYGITDRVQLDISVPFMNRTTTFNSGGAEGAANKTIEKKVSQNNTLGDVSAGAYVNILQDVQDYPDLVWNVRIKAPTGKDPFGISTTEVEGSQGNLRVPDELSTGSGLWSVSSGISLSKTIDPAIVFANIGYTRHINNDFNDIDSNKDSETPGEFDQGDAWQFGMGIGVALNERLNITFSYAQQVSKESKIRNKAGKWGEITGSDANSATVNTSVTMALTNHLSLVASVGIGVTVDAPDVLVGLRLPYRF